MWISFVFMGDGCYFARGGKVTKTPPGDGSDERLRGAGAHSHLSPGPPFYGGGSLQVFGRFRRAKSRSVSVLLSGHRAFLPTKFVSCCCLLHTAWCLPTCLVRRWSGRGPQQLPSCHDYAGVGGVTSAQNLLNFGPGRGLCPRGKKGQPLIIGVPAKAQRSGFGGERRSKGAA